MLVRSPNSHASDNVFTERSITFTPTQFPQANSYSTHTSFFRKQDQRPPLFCLHHFHRNSFVAQIPPITEHTSSSFEKMILFSYTSALLPGARVSSDRCACSRRHPLQILDGLGFSTSSLLGFFSSRDDRPVGGSGSPVHVRRRMVRVSHRATQQRGIVRL